MLSEISNSIWMSCHSREQMSHKRTTQMALCDIDFSASFFYPFSIFNFKAVKPEITIK